MFLPHSFRAFAFFLRYSAGLVNMTPRYFKNQFWIDPQINHDHNIFLTKRLYMRPWKITTMHPPVNYSKLT